MLNLLSLLLLNSTWKKTVLNSFKTSILLKSKNDGDQVLVVTEKETYRFDALLYATGRKPNVEPLQLENTDIELTERGAIKVDKHCQTNVPGVFAVGDVNGGLQFTYISLDDFRVVYSYLASDGSYTLEDRSQCSKHHVHHTSTFTSWFD